MSDIEKTAENNYVIYILINEECTNNCTYVGMTNNTVRRIRQHNGELVGGAKYTKMKKGTGKWKYYGWIENVNKKTALSLEKRIQIRSRKVKGNKPIDRRLEAVKQILDTYNETNKTDYKLRILLVDQHDLLDN